VFGGASGTEADHHPGLDKFNRTKSGPLFQFILFPHAFGSPYSSGQLNTELTSRFGVICTL
jgi:hypothetical protein